MLPSKIRVKLLSEAAGYVTVSHVVQRDFSMRELIEVLVPVIGADAERIRQILKAGTIVAGDYRYRWESLEIEINEVDGVLEALPHPEPSRTFQSERADRVRFRREHDVLELSREFASRKPLFARQSLWDGLLNLFGDQIRYSDYSHPDKADVFAADLNLDDREKLSSLLPLLKPKSMAARVEAFKPERIEWLVRR